jgi:hypothetical protein
MTTTWTANIIEEKDTGGFLLPLPDELINSMGWSEGEELSWEITSGNTLILSKRIVVLNEVQL